jgi:RND family efflux transporter MFP subunit
MQSILKPSLFIFSICILLTSCGGKAENNLLPENLAKVSIKSVSKNNVGEQLNYSGTIQADNIVQLSFSVPGRIADISVEEGQHVNDGQLLATIETTEYQNALTIAKAGFEQAEDNFKRSTELHQKGSLTDRDYVAAKVALTQAEANKNLAEKRLSDSYLHAPFTGIVTVKSTERGASALPGVPVFTLMKTDFVNAQVAVPESDISKLAIGSGATIIVASLSDTVHGTISIINPQADALSKTFIIKIKIPNANGKLLPGMISEVKIATGKTLDVITVPGESILRDADDLTYVFVVNSEKRAVRKRVNASGLSDSAVIVTSGLNEGDQVVTTGQKYIKEGQKLSVN